MNWLFKSCRPEKTIAEHWCSPEPTAEAIAIPTSGETKGRIMGLLFTSLEEGPLWSWGSALRSACCLAASEGAVNWAYTVRNCKKSGKMSLLSHLLISLYCLLLAEFNNQMAKESGKRILQSPSPTVREAIQGSIWGCRIQLLEFL